jgi:dihydroorotase
MEHFDLVLKDATTISSRGKQICDLGIVDQKISKIGTIAESSADKCINLKGLHILPGVIDSQVHFREPGKVEKEDIKSGSTAACLGGVTAFLEMPNTNPPTTSLEAHQVKLDIAGNTSLVDYGFFLGASPDNLELISTLQRKPGLAGIKIFMGSSTGNLLLEDREHVESVLRNTDLPIAVHSEDEQMLRQRFDLVKGSGRVEDHPLWRSPEVCFKCTRDLVSIAKKVGRKVHILHITSEEEILFLKDNKDYCTVEVTPQHLTLFAPDCYKELGTLAQMNPPIREKHHLDQLWEGISNGTADVIGSDHAPHLLSEKEKIYPSSPSGMPGVQTLLPVMLDHVSKGKLSLERLVELVCFNPAKIYSMGQLGDISEGKRANLTVVDLKAERVIENSWIASKCGWTPFQGRKCTGWPTMTIVGGEILMQDNVITDSRRAAPIEFL